MNMRSLGQATALVTLIAVTAACGGGTPPSAAGTVGSAPPIEGNDPPVTLRLGIADPEGRQSEPAALKFVERVAALSNGNITIEPTFEAGDGTNVGFETSVDELVKRGDLEFGMSGARSWDKVGVTSLRALQAPFVIDSQALAVAVAKSDIATRAMEGMADAGVVGLALWPEDLRHLFSFPKCGKDFRTPAGIAGATILTIPSQVSQDVIAALGGLDFPDGDRGTESDACRLHGMEAGSAGVGLPVSSAVSTGNVVLFPKYQMLTANAAALARLSDGQRAIIRQAASETQVDAYTRAPDEANLAATWCAGGGTVQLASADQIAELTAATAPVIQSLERDALTKELIADIAALKATVAAKPFDSPCGPVVAQPLPSVDTTGFVATMIPDGVYRTEITQEDLVAKGTSPEFAARNWGVKTWTFTGDTWKLDQGANGGDPCFGTYKSVAGDHLEFVTEGGGCGVEGWMLWRPDGVDDVVLLQPTGDDISFKDFTEITAFFDRVLTKID